jgi:hypothetical protein
MRWTNKFSLCCLTAFKSEAKMCFIVGGEDVVPIVPQSIIQ